MTSTTGQVRATFEAWATSPALDMDISRHPADDDTWAGQYIDAGVQRAWEAWQAAIAQQPEALPKTREELIPIARETLRQLGVVDDLLDAAIRRCEAQQPAVPEGE